MSNLLCSAGQVMLLCDRPVTKKKTTVLTTNKKDVGLVPARDVETNAIRQIKERKKAPGITKKAIREIMLLEARKKSEQELEQDARKRQDSNEYVVRAVCDKARAEVRDMLKETAEHILETEEQKKSERRRKYLESKRGKEFLTKVLGADEVESLVSTARKSVESEKNTSLNFCSKSSKTSVKKRPTWSLTKEAVDENEVMETESLLNFAHELNADQMLYDCEMKSMLHGLKKKANELYLKEKEEQKEQDKTLLMEIQQTTQNSVNVGADPFQDCASDVGSVVSDSMSALDDWDFASILTACEAMKDGAEKTKALAKIAKTLLEKQQHESSDDKVDLKQHHSVKSLAKLIEKIITNKSTKDDKCGGASILKVHEPKIVTHHIREKSTKVNPNTLPYQFQNPSL